MSISRREFVADLGAVGALWFAAATGCRESAPDAASHLPHLPDTAEAPAPPPGLVTFTPEQAADVEAITARIFPTDDSPGAREAGVINFIDRELVTFPPGQKKAFMDGLAQFEKDVAKRHPGKRFAALTETQQDAFLKRIEDAEFFGNVRFATIAGMFALPKYGGNRDYLGWQLIGQDRAFEHKPPFGWYDRPENQMALLGRVL